MEEKKEMPKPTTVYCLFTMEAGVVGSATHNLKACWFRKPHFNQLCKIFGIDLKLDSSESLEVVVDILALIQEHGTTLQKLADMYRQGDDVRMGDTYYRLREVECGKEIKPEMYG